MADRQRYASQVDTKNACGVSDITGRDSGHLQGEIRYACPSRIAADRCMHLERRTDQCIPGKQREGCIPEDAS
jgi:hypothetical protein